MDLYKKKCAMVEVITSRKVLCSIFNTFSHSPETYIMLKKEIEPYDKIHFRDYGSQTNIILRKSFYSGRSHGKTNG